MEVDELSAVTKMNNLRNFRQKVNVMLSNVKLKRNSNWKICGEMTKNRKKTLGSYDHFSYFSLGVAS